MDDQEVDELKKLLGDPSEEEDSDLLKMLEEPNNQHSAPPYTDPGATQRVSISHTGKAVQAPARRQNPQQATPKRTAATEEKKKQKKRREQITIITLFSIAAFLLVAIILVVSSLFKKPEDDHRILNNTYAAGIHLGGMTQEQAKKALLEATKDTYSTLDMTVTVLDTVITLSPVNTGAVLNVDAIVEAAYSRGRTNAVSDLQAQTAFHIPLLPHLSLDTDYIRDEVDKLGKKYSTTLSQPTYSISGEAPSMDMEEKDTSVVYQTLTIHIGTAEYGLNTEKLYEQIMDAYNSNLFQVTGECTVVAPTSPNCDEIYKKYCTDPVDAVFNPDNYSVTPEIYGYGFDLNALKLMVADAEYGAKLEIPLKFIRPSQTAEDLSGDNFRDVLFSYSSALSPDANYNRNMLLACNALNGLILKPGDAFSFNEIIGQPTINKGFKAASVYVGRDIVLQVGGGLSQVASTLYYCALMADLEITERVNHTYTPEFCNIGTDADINYGVFDLRFNNTTGYPIRIEAAIVDDQVIISLIGTNNNEYTVQIEYVTDKTYEPNTMFVTMPNGNPGGYLAGDILVTPITGFAVSTYRCVYSKDSDILITRDLLTQSFYEKRNQVVVEIYIAVIPDPTNPTESTDPSDTTDSTSPSGTTNPTAPSNPTTPTTPTAPSNPTTPTNPSNPTAPTDSTKPTGTQETIAN